MTQRSDVGQYIGKINAVEALQRCCNIKLRYLQCLWVKENTNGMNYIDNETYGRIHFAVIAIESGARKLNISGKEMHDRLQKLGLIHSRLIKKYEDLHTQSLDWVADDIVETLLNWEAEL